MSKQEEIKIVLGNKKFAGASNKPLSVPVFLGNEKRDLIDGTRSDVVNLLDLFNEERAESTKIRISGKITNIFDNSISGKTSYVPFRNNLYYVKPELSVVNSIWKGYPQYDEFTFI